MPGILGLRCNSETLREAIAKSTAKSGGSRGLRGTKVGEKSVSY